MANNPHLADDGRPYQFSSTRQPANAGRKPSRLRKYIKDNNLSAIDISIIARVLLNKSRDELKKIIENPKEAILISGCAAALLKDMARGITATQQWLADRAVGKTPDKLIAVTEDLTYLTKEERDAEIKRIYQDHFDQLRGGGDATAGPADGAPGRAEEAEQEKPGTPEEADHD